MEQEDGGVTWTRQRAMGTSFTRREVLSLYKTDIFYRVLDHVISSHFASLSHERLGQMFFQGFFRPWLFCDSMSV